MARWLHDILVALGSLLAAVRTDLLALAGLALLGHGLWQYSPRLAEVVVGALMVLGAVLAVRARG